MTARNASLACLLVLALACSREPTRTKSDGPISAGGTSAAATSKPRTQSLVEPTRLMKLPVSAYHVSLALDDSTVYLLTPNAAFKLIAGQPSAGIELDLGYGAAMTHSSFIFWSKGAIWRAPKEGGESRPLAKFPHSLQYFVTSGESFAWVDKADNGLYTIQSLRGKTPRVLVSSMGEISALNLVGDTVFFVQRPSDGTWHVGRVHLTGGEPEYGDVKKGPTPSMLTGSDALYYYSLDKIEIRKLSLDLKTEQTVLKKFVCSPIHVDAAISCACVEGLFDVHKESYKPRVLVFGRPGAITYVRANAEVVAWTTDVGADMLTVDMLKLDEVNAQGH